MKFMCTKYGWNAKKSVHFIDAFMGGIFWGHPVQTMFKHVVSGNGQLVLILQSYSQCFTVKHID